MRRRRRGREEEEETREEGKRRRGGWVEHAHETGANFCNALSRTVFKCVHALGVLRFWTLGPLFVCVCVYVCLYMYVGMYVCMCVCVYMCICVYVCMCVCVYVCMYDVRMCMPNPQPARVRKQHGGRTNTYGVI